MSAEASLPRGWEIAGLWRFGDEWIALSEEPDRNWTHLGGILIRRSAGWQIG